jgi:hypothetical protein
MMAWQGRCAVAMGLVLSACTPTRREATCDDADEPVQLRAGATSDLPVITTLRTRDREVDVFASAHGLRFTVRDADGSVLAERVDRSGLARTFPTLLHHFDTAFAGELGWLDASAEPRVLSEHR